MTIVVKLGSSLVTDGAGRIRRSQLAARAADIDSIRNAGDAVCVVSSGAIALGRPMLGLERGQRATAQLQAASAAGQVRLQLAWEAAFRPHGIRVGQVLLSANDLADRASYLNARNALRALLQLHVVPVINENDATATDEITFGDNDALAAQVAVLLGARLLVLLTEVDGVYTSHPADASSRPVEHGDEITEASFGVGTSVGRGGMATKVAAARLAAGAGIPTVIASGRTDGIVTAIVQGAERGTRFAPSQSTASAYKLWLRHAKPTAGVIVIDEGARQAIVEDSRSLLAVGIVDTHNHFVAGDAVQIECIDGNVIGKGIASVDASDLRSRPRNVEAVHRDRLVLY